MPDFKGFQVQGRKLLAVNFSGAKFLRSSIYLLLFCCLSVIQRAEAQNYPISNTSVNTCSGNFYDSGGNGGAYGNNENFVMTFCPATAGNCIRLTFSQFNIENGYDFLTVYDGNTTGAPVIGTYTGTTVPPIITATSGCLTIRFTSDNIITAAGWAASVSCVSCPGSACPNCNGGTPPANDACSGAQNLGNLPLPAACPNGTGTWAVFNTTNICATAESPYSTLTGCQPSGNMASPAADVWYRINITGPTLNVQISGLQNPNLGLYAGTNCNNLIGRGCAIGSAGVLNTSFGGLAPGTYFLQISGGNINDQCDFTLSLQNNFDCAGCVIQSNLTVNPPPVNGTYNAGQSVTFCYSITDFNQTSINWLHGVVPDFGPGWDMSTLTTVPANSCSGQGTWGWYNTNVTSTATGQVSGPGFYYESALGNPLGVTDANPGNNFGDNNPSNLCDWTFCWTISTLPPAQCVNGASLNITIDTYGDGESGSWTSLACVGDAVTDFFATLACCETPDIVTTDPDCGGATNGSATATGKGTGPWDYVWKDNTGTVIFTANNINGTNTLNNLPAGNYSVTVTDNAGCAATATFTLSTSTAVTINTVVTNVNCNGGNGGSILANANGGTGAISFSLNGGPAQASGSFSGLTAGNYSVTATDANGCTAVTNVVITEPPPIQDVTNIVNTLCFGSSNGAITVVANGGTGALSYSLNGGAPQANGNFTILTAGNYTVVVTDTKGCTHTVNAVITQPSQMQIGAAGTNALCNGTATGSITVNANGGTGAFQYHINGGPNQPSNIFNNLTAGLYNVVAVDANGCQAATNVNIGQPAVLTSNNATTNALCNGSADGTITVNANGGTSPYQFSLNGGPSQPTGNFTGLAAGNYSVIVTDQNGCTSMINQNITEPTLLNAVTVAADALCNGSADGNITVNANGGTGVLSYSLNGAPAQPGNNFSNLAAGNYSITVTDANGCSYTLNQVISEPPLLQLQSNTTDVLCNGQNNGQIDLIAAGGTGTYNYALNGGAQQPGTTFASLTAGNYQITVTDANGCTAIANAVIVEPPVLQIALVTADVLCNGGADGSITVNAAGGIGLYTYSMNGGAPQAAAQFNNLSAGAYNITITDGNGCTTSQAININEPTLLQGGATPTDALCFGASDGTVVVNASGGAGTYAFSLNNGPGQPSGNFSNLTAGNYNVIVTDQNGCSYNIPFVIAEPTLLIAAAGPTDALCNGSNDGIISVNANGGTAPYLYDLNGTGATAASIFNNLGAGNYSVVVTDDHGCTALVNAVINEPAVLQSVSGMTDALCNGSADGAIAVNTAGGTAPYTYSLNGGAATASGNFTGLTAGNYTVIVTDNNGCTELINGTINEPTPLIAPYATSDVLCNGNADGALTVNAAGGTAPYNYSLNGAPSVPSGIFSGLTAGVYNILVTDQHGCTFADNIIVNEPTPLQIGVTPDDALCNGAADGAITVNASGGVNPISYSLNGAPAQPAAFFPGLTAGNYTVTITDGNGCTMSLNTTINEPSILQGAIIPSNALCAGSNDGTIDASANGGSGPYTYSLNGGPSQANGLFNSLASGNYSVQITDANGCTTILNVVINEPAVLQGIPVVTNTNCNGGSDGAIDITPSGGTPPYDFAINGNPGQASGNFPGLPAGAYTVIITDANGCTETINQQVNEPTAIVVATSSSPASCGGNDGGVSLVAGGGTGVLQYSIDNGNTYQSAATFNNLLAGNYAVVVMDANGCTATAAASVSNTAAPIINNTVVVDLDCWQSGNGMITINAASGTPPLQYSIDNGNTYQATPVFNNLSAGNYNIVVTDALGCDATAAVAVNEPAQLVFNAIPGNSTCGNSNASITINANGGTGAITYSINNGLNFQASPLFSNLAAGNYTIVVQDGNGCTSTALLQVNNVAGPVLSAATGTNLTCNGADDGIIVITSNGGTAPIQYSIDNGTTYLPSGNFNSLPPGNYQVKIIDANGCTAVSSVLISEPPSIQCASSTTPASCGNSDGSLSLNAAGGTGALQYSIDNGLTFQANPLFNNLLAGSYNVVVKDQNGCLYNLIVNVNNAAAPSLTNISTIDALCAGANNGSITIAASGGTGALVYSIDGGNNFQAGNNFTNLPAGNYNIVVADINGCEDAGVAIISEPVLLTAASNATNETCTAANGSITINANGGTAPYSYQLNGNPGNPVGQFNNLSAGNYQIIVTDQHNCTATVNLSISNAPSPVVSALTKQNISCFGLTDGSISIHSAGGTQPLAFSIDNGANYVTDSVFVALSQGNYQIVIQDQNGCTAAVNAIISEPQPINISYAFTPATCGSNDGTITLSAVGGTGAFTYSINNGNNFQASTFFSALFAGGYPIVVRDQNNCTADTNLTINNTAAPVIQSVNATDISCKGVKDGTITINANGGTGFITYSINGGFSYQIGNLFTGLAAGNYQIIVTDSTGCDDVTNIVLSEPTQLTVSTGITGSTCGLNNGAINVTANGGTAPYSYSLNGGAAGGNPLFNALASGSYTVLTVDANGCSKSSTLNITAAPAPLINQMAATNVNCYGASNGTINITTSGGTAPIQYSIDGGNIFQSSNQFSGVPPGNYQVVVIDANNCNATGNTQITQPAQLQLSGTITDATCNQSNGSIVINALGGNGTLTYSIDNGNSFQSSTLFSGLAANTYNVIVKDLYGCTAASAMQVVNAAAPVISAMNVIDVNCFGNNNGSIQINAAGGTLPLTYSINNGFNFQSSAAFSSLNPGAYQVIVKDANGCTATAAVNITQPAAITLSLNVTTATCGNNDGAIIASAQGGSGNLSYSLNGGTGQGNGQFLNLIAGNYTIQITDQSGCTTSQVGSVGNTNAPQIVSVSSADPLCSGDQNGSITINATGGTGTLNYSIDNGTTFSLNNVFSQIPGGVYSIVVNDLNNCISTYNITLNDPDPLQIGAIPTNASCGMSNGVLNLAATGGTGTLNYSIDNGNTYQLATYYNNLATANYQIIVADNNNCTASITAIITDQPGPIFTVPVATDISCFGFQDGNISINATGGTGSLSYSINNGGSFQFGNLFQNLSAGNYTCVIKDNNGCTADTILAIDEPLPIQQTVAVTPAICSLPNGAINITANGGTGNLTFSIDNGVTFQVNPSFLNMMAGNYAVQVADQNGCVADTNLAIPDAPGPLLDTVYVTDITCFGLLDGMIQIQTTGGTAPVNYSIGGGGQTSATFNNLSPGSYSIIVTDFNGCTAVSQAAIVEPDELIVLGQTTAALCNGDSTGAASLLISGGTTPYSYQWTGSASTSNSAGNLSSGSYGYTVTDANGCLQSGTVIVNQPNPISISGAVTDISCFGFGDGQISVTGTGGTGVLSFSWPALGTGGNLINNVNAGTYNVIATDAHNCTGTNQFTVAEPSALTYNLSATDADCYGAATGSVSLLVNGGIAPYQYLWSNGITQANLIQLAAGSYSVDVTDANGCTALATATVGQPDSLIIAFSGTDPDCYQAATGSLSAQCTGGTSPYQYQWSNLSTSASITGLLSGVYQLTVTDAHGCITLNQSQLVQPAQVVASVTGATLICIGQNTFISAGASGGTGSYTYSWSNGNSSSSQMVSPAVTTVYTVNVVDQNGCAAAPVTVTVNVNPPLSLVISPADTLCFGETTSVAATVSGGDGGPYTYTWSHTTMNAAQLQVAPAVTTTYQVAVNDGCGTPSVNGAVQILVNPLPLADFDIFPPQGCMPLEVNFSNNSTPPASGAVYEWNLGDQTTSSSYNVVHTYTTPGVYDIALTVTSAEGCKTTLAFNDTITVFELPRADFSYLPHPVSILDPTVRFTDLSYGAATWQWDFGDHQYAAIQHPVHLYGDTGVYKVVLYITSDDGCADSAYTEIVIKGTSTIYIPNAFTPNFDGVNDVFKAEGIGIIAFEMIIFNRWGNVVFKSSDMHFGWDGTDIFTGEKSPNDVYIYLIRARGVDSATNEHTGRVTLVR